MQDPYFNEPGYESTMSTEDGKNRSRTYNDIIREKTIKWGMIEALKHPAEGFQLVITTHFKLKKNLILEEIALWLDEALGEGRKSTFKNLNSELNDLLSEL